VQALMAASLLVWLIVTNWGNDQSVRTYVPRRLRKSSQFIQWLKSKIKDHLGQPLDDYIYSIKVSRTRADRHRRRRPRRLPYFFWLLGFLFASLFLLPFQLASLLRPPTRIPTFCFTASSNADSSAIPNTLVFDSESFTILVDNGASHSFTTDQSDFVEPPTPLQRRVVGVGNGMATHVGTVEWPIMDDDGRVTCERYPGVFLCKDMPCRVLSPQHWAQSRKDFRPQRDGTRCITTADAVILEWDQQTKRRTMPLRPGSTNVGIMRSAPSISRFHALCSLLKASKIPFIEGPTCFTTHVIPPDEDVDDDDDVAVSEGDNHDESSTSYTGAPSASEGDVEAPTAADSTERVQQARDASPGTSQQPTTLRETPILIDFEEENLPDDEADDEIELSNPQEELMRQHIRLGHLPFFKLRAMANKGLLPRKIAQCQTPKCAACMFAKATRRPWLSSDTEQPVQPRKATSPGECVSVDQLESSTPGLVAQLKGKPTKARYRVATVFVDHFSRLSYVHFQKSSSAEETVEAKRAFEIYAKSHNVTVRHYHADNGRFAELLFTQEIAKCGQSISFCGVNAHFQNGIAERRIRELQDQARTNLVFAEQRWPNAVNTHLWPYAVRHVNEVFNCTPHSPDELPPVSKFAGTNELPKTKHFHHFGCPVYVTDAGMQQGRKGSKWLKRARLGLYLGTSPLHSRSVALVLNLQTGLASPQFHVAFDDTFETVRAKSGNKYAIVWQEATGFVEPTSPPAAPAGTPPERPAAASSNWQTARPPAAPTSAPTAESRVESHDVRVGPSNEPIPTTETAPAAPETVATPPPDSGLRRSARSRKPTQRLLESGLPVAFTSRVDHELLYYQDHAEERLQAELEDPIACVARSDPDTMHYHQAMKAPDKDKFVQAMCDEIQAHVDNGHWEIVERSKVPEGTKVLAAVWAMRRKRRIATREVYKWKARLNVHGGQQEKGVNFWETYAPVVQWVSIRIFLIVALLNDWHTRQIDFVLAYPQADIECDLYMEIPFGFEFEGNRETHVLKLKKNLYGQKQAGRVWNLHLHKGLTEKLGFTQSAVDPCVYFRGTTVLMIYVDDGILTSPNAAELDQIISELGEHFKVTDEGEIDDYLGVKAERQSDGSIKLSQPHLIDSILRDLRFTREVNAAKTPAASTVILNRDENGKEFDESFHYRAVIGKLNFLEKSTRPDIAYAVHQAARFSADPKESHGRAVRRLCRYLAGTRDKGLILHPRLEEGFQIWVDADFCGLWNKETAPTDPSTARSRTGYVVTYAGCPVAWISRLQTEVAHSSTEAEYVALSQALRDCIPMMHLLQEAASKGVPISTSTPIFRCTVFEDNAGCVELANVPKMRPRTRHINLKYHHFREFVATKLIRVLKVDGDNQLADQLTKPLSDDKFLHLRKGLLGW
jgi:Reverse transcriptase (RNA-dependent DNA polymerase)